MAIMERLRGYFLNNYESMHYLEKTRAKILFYFLIAFIFFTVLLQFSMLFAGWYDFIVTIPMTSIMFIGLSLSLMFLRKGRYMIAADMFIAFSALAVVGGLIRQPFQELNLSLTSYIYFIYPIIGLSAIFTNVRFLTIISAFFAVSDVALFIICRRLESAANQKMVVIAFNNSLFAILFLYLVAFLIMKVFERSVSLANSETEKNVKSNRFIKQVLMESSWHVVTAMNEMSEQSDRFSESAHDQAASIEEITATIEEVSSGIDNVSSNALGQSESLVSLVATLDELSRIIADIDTAIGDSLQSTGEITVKARSGEDHLRVMEEGIGKVRDSSQEMTNIIGIINDISDKINLLSLNAAIEAARAGDAGRGFAVVADEISKLADGTASSIKSIEGLIKTNENEIARGLSGVTMAVNVIKSVIDGISDVNRKIQSLNEFKRRQLDTNLLVNESAKTLKQRSEEISTATREQKTAIEEIVRNISAMSEQSQNNTAHAVKMSYDSQNLVDLVMELKKKIEEYDA